MATKSAKAALGQAKGDLPLSIKVRAVNARAAKAVIIRVLAAREAMLKTSADSGKHDEKGRMALLVAVRVLQVAIANISDNLLCG